MRSPRSVILIALILAGCASGPAGAPPWELLQDCQEPETRVATNGQMAETVRQMRDALRGCNQDKKHLREWFE